MQKKIKKVVMELVDMNSLGLFDFKILSVQVGFTLYIPRTIYIDRTIVYSITSYLIFIMLRHVTLRYAML